MMAELRSQAERFGASVKPNTIVSVDFSRRPFVCTDDRGNVYKASTVIVSTGASAKYLGLPDEDKYKGLGVSACATCVGFFYRNRDVAVIGGGNSAVEEALYLTNFANTVTLVHRRDQLRADKTMQERLLNNKKIIVEWDSVVEDIIGSDNPRGVTALKLKNVKTDTMKTINIDGVFIAIGHHPNTDLFKGQLDLDSEGYIITKPDSCQTSVPGIFAAGDVQNAKFRQAVVAAGSGCMAALEAERYLSRL